MTTETIKLRPGQAGGHATLVQYGSAYYSRIGRLGGRPRSLTLGEIKQRRASSAGDLKKEVVHGEGLSLAKLKRLYAERGIGRQ